ncbi:hypothetical protein DYBT9275_00355 [Dyadobacter sp. CECT 9275]|uniref:DUF3464 family protein n=1 Tax=Dyadobacter helix TaxID=2822344 RepID=A0A916J9W5_9BACT|nr:hypothetical protein [Dyadobacter sp. CECT 9275]CAG4989717.1 hypothetical protein DYBT9275_00355 [Dyadobacter sp. CECT 9275]
MNRQLLYTLLIAGMSLATAWAIRGQFGHEQGAAWAGGVGGLAIVLLAKRADWYAKVFQLTLASAAGWGIGGIISYGIVVGYGRGSDFGNVYYGLSMLFVIGGLFGLIGGGLFGLTLSDTKENPVKWPSLIVEMAIGAFIFYYLLIEELHWLMTPPRSEAWAGCLGMTVAMFWYMIRNRHYSAIRLAVFAGFGGGFGFAFGNFLQVMGGVSGIKFNFWNVMEYSIGFFGGIGMAYGTFTSEWPRTDETINRNKFLAPLIIIILIIPFIVWEQSLGTERLMDVVKGIDPITDGTGITRNIQWIALISILLLTGYWIYYFYFRSKENIITIGYQDIYKLFLLHLGQYAFFSLLITCAFMSTYRPEQYLYLVNLALIAWLIGKPQPAFTSRGLNVSRWAINFIFILAVIALLTAVAVSSHGELKGAQIRF